MTTPAGRAVHGMMTNRVAVDRTVTGGGGSGAALNSRTLTGKSARNRGGGAYLGTLNRCMPYYNTGRRLHFNANRTLDHYCGAPAPWRHLEDAAGECLRGSQPMPGMPVAYRVVVTNSPRQVN